ncbi:uncharacterized protein LOC131940024 [Physella acuta]|uniref:uncharacterized protein LOC131940024 n=1 Tax=Physella acuta TaxID=109671 RepID=UPI0027DD2943|nr:uncharacterized protein LOC131940024 [Physella acuta]
MQLTNVYGIMAASNRVRRGVSGGQIVVLAALLVTWVQGEHKALEPLDDKRSSGSGRDAAILLVPEVGVSHLDYELFGRIIQQIYPSKLWIGLIDTSTEGSLTLDNLPLLMDESVRELKKLGLSVKHDLFLAAHGQPGQVAANYAEAMYETLRGLILLGSFLPKMFNFVSFPLPVLTLIGELDGVTRVTGIAQSIQALIHSSQFDSGFVIQSPLVILEGGNHAIFISGTLPPDMHELDIEPEVDNLLSMERASTLTSHFLSNVLREPEELAITAAAEFKLEFEKAVNITQPIRFLRDSTEKNLESFWVRTAQKWLSGMEGKDSSEIEVQSLVGKDSNDFGLPPAIITEHGINKIVTFSDIIRSSDDVRGGGVIDSSLMAPEEIAAKMLGPERIQAYVKNSTIAQNYTCRDLNYASFVTAYNTASDTARQRYDRYRRGAIFEPDIVTDSEVLWQTTKLKVETKGTELYVTSIAFKTPHTENLGPEDGLFFCKLLPPDRALEWIYVDSLRRSIPPPRRKL